MNTAACININKPQIISEGKNKLQSNTYNMIPF